MDQDYYINLIYKQLKGIISDKEALELQDWQQSSAENQALKTEIYEAWENSERYELPFELNLDEDYAQLQSKIKQSDHAQKVKKLPTERRNNYWWRIAAALAIILLAGFLLRNFLNQEEKWLEQTAEKEILEINLQDGTKVFLNTGSSLSYPETFSSKERLVRLKGEAFFEVVKDQSKPFRVNSPELEVQVLGTSFNVRDELQNGLASVSVEEGKVKVSSIFARQTLMLVAQESAILENNTLEKKQDTNLNTLAWKRKSLSFSNTRLEYVIDDIARQYGLKISLDNPFTDDCPFSGRFSTDLPIENIFKMLNDIHDIEVQKINEQEYLLIGGRCK